MARFNKPITWRAWSLCKRGNQADEYEDAHAANPEVGRFAVADGASESSFAGLWAQLLVDRFVRRLEKTETEVGWLEGLRRHWAKQVDDQALPWYAEEKRRQGAFATFLGLRLKGAKKGTGGSWRATAIGDSCLFHVRAEVLVQAFPLTSSAEFGNQPNLLGSRPNKGGASLQQEQAKGRWQPGDCFLLMTDALAQWFLKQTETDKRPVEAIDKVLARTKTESAFATWIEELREQQVLRNDDVTLLTITV